MLSHQTHKGETKLKSKNLKYMLCLALALILLSGCSSGPAAAAEVRAGEWVGRTDFGSVTLTVDPSGISISKAVIEYTCSSGAVSFSETVSIDGGAKGWAIQNNKFSIDMEETAQVKVTGKFSSDNTQASGTLKAMKCSGKWEASR
jgi:hypothetical protein